MKYTLHEIKDHATQCAKREAFNDDEFSGKSGVIIDDLLGRITDLEKDAARYRWLKADGEDVDIVRERSDVFNFEWGDELDSAIDAAMKESK